MTYKNIGKIEFEPELTNEEVEDLHAYFSGGIEHDDDDVFSLAHRINDIVNNFLKDDELTAVRRRRRK